MKLLLVLPLLVLSSISTAHATTILACSTNGGSWTQSGCATPSMFSNFSASLDWGAPTTAGSWAAHPLEAGLGTANNNNWSFASNGDWIATASNGVQVGVGVGAGFAPTDQVLQRVDNAQQYYSTLNSGNGWANVSSHPDGYYSGYNVFAGHGDSAPIQTTASGGFMNYTNQTDQYYSGPYFWSHGGATPVGSGSASAVPWLGDHLVGTSTGVGQSMILDFTNAGIDAAAFTIVGRSNSQTNNQGTAQANMAAAGAAGRSNIFEIHVRAFSGLGGTGSLLYDYDMEISGGGFGTCALLSSSTPIPCNDAPAVQILGTPGVFNIRSLLITSSTDASGFYLDELYLDQQGGSILGQTPEPAEMFLIGGGLMLLGVIARRQAVVR
jgi:hypothetical protein